MWQSAYVWGSPADLGSGGGRGIVRSESATLTASTTCLESGLPKLRLFPLYVSWTWRYFDNALHHWWNYNLGVHAVPLGRVEDIVIAIGALFVSTTEILSYLHTKAPRRSTSGLLLPLREIDIVIR